MKKLNHFSKCLVLSLLLFLLPGVLTFSDDLSETPEEMILDELEKILNEKEALLNQREQNLNEREQNLNQQETELNEREKSINQRETSLNARSSLMTDFENYLQNLKEDNWIDKLTWFGIGFFGGFGTGTYAGIKIGISL